MHMDYQIYSSTDNGNSWNLCMNGIGQNVYTTNFLKSPSGTFYLFVSGSNSQLYRYTPASNSWALVQLPFGNYYVDGIDIDPQGRIWVSGDASYSVIQVSTDEGQTFQQVTSSGQMLGWYDILTTYNDDHNLLAVSYGAGQKVYHFTKAGVVQQVISGSPVQYVGYNLNTGTAYYSDYDNSKRSTDGGLTWENITLVPGQSYQPYISDMFFESGGKLWAYAGSMYYSEDDGVTWAKDPVFDGTSANFFRMENGDWFATNGCSDPNFSRSTDGGITWDDLSDQFQQPNVQDIKKDAAGSLYAYTCRRDAYEKSNDEGQTWSDFTIFDSIPVFVNSLATRPDGVMMATGANGKFYRSLNNGSDWEEITNLSPLWGDSFWGAKFYVDYNGSFYFFEELGGVLKSTNNGDSWQSLNAWSDFQYSPPAFHPNGDIFLSDIFYASVYVASADTVKTIEFDDQPFTPDISRVHCTNNGMTFISISSPISDISFYRILPDGNYHPEPVLFFQGNFTISAITSNTEGDVFVSNSSHVYKSEDDGLTWQIIAPIPDNNTYIPVLYVAPDQYLYAGLEGDVIHRSAQPTAENNRIFGKIWLDDDGDCQYDAGEQLRPSIAVTATGNSDYTSFSGYNGSFILSAPSGAYALNVKAPNALYEACFSDVPVTLNGPNDSVFADLPLKAVAQCPYLRVSMSTPILRRCFDITYTVRYKNEGTAVAENAYVQVTLDSFFIFQNATIPVATQNGFTYTFNLGDLAPGQSGSFNIVVTISCEASLGELHCVNAQIFPSDVCLPTLPPIAFYRECRENIGSFDPNDKRAFVDGNEESGYVLPNTDIEYFIRFQNTGTDTAFRVVIEDRLSTLLDLASVTPLVSSHPYTMEVKDQRVLRFIFDNILLPDSNINEPASHGFIKLRVSQMPDVALGSVIRNEADIFFDFNAPVRTNQSSLIVGTVSTKPEPGNPYLVTAYPNPFNTTVTFEIAGPALPGTATLRLFDALGRQVRREEFAGEKFVVQRHDLETGLYYFLIESEGKRIGAGKVMAH